MVEFAYQDMLPLGADDTPYRLLTSDFVTDRSTAGGRRFVEVDPEALTLLDARAMHDIAHLLRPGHLAQLRAILDDPEASPNDRFVALELLKNVCIAAGGVLPSCQDTGTAIVKGKKGELVLTGGGDREAIARGIFRTYADDNLRYSQLAPLDTYDEKNTGTNLPAEIEIEAVDGDAYKLLFMAKGGGSANKSLLFQETKALLNPDGLMRWLDEKLRTLGTAACPPYHLALVIGGTSAEFALKTAKLASARYLDTLPRDGQRARPRLPRCRARAAGARSSRRQFGIGAQFGGKYFCHDVRVIRLPRHGASCPVALAVSCSADRQALGKITAEGVFLEQLETDPAKYLPDVTEDELDDASCRDRSQPADGRDPAHAVAVSGQDARDADRPDGRRARHRARQDQGTARRRRRLPAVPPRLLRVLRGAGQDARGYASGSFGPTTAGRMDSYVDVFQRNGGSLVMLAKGNRSQVVTDACQEHGGFYLGSIGGPAARLAKDCITNVEVLEYPELGMEAVWKIEVRDFPAFIVVDDKGNDFFAAVSKPAALR